MLIDVNLHDSFLAALVATIWGFNFVVIGWGMAGVPPLLFLTVRFIVVLIPAVFVLPRPAAPWPTIVAVGALMSLGQFAFLYLALDAGLPPGIAALVLQAQVMFTVLIAAAALGERQVTIDVIDTSGTALSANRWLMVSEGASPLNVVVSGDNNYESIDSVGETYDVTISSDSNDKLKGLQLEVFVNEVSVGTTVADGENGSWSIDGVDLGQQDGDRTIRVEVTDGLGNEWSSSRTVEVDIDSATTMGSANPESMAFMFDDALAVEPNGILDFLSASGELAVSDSSQAMATRAKPVARTDVDTTIALVDYEATSAPAFDDALDIGFDLYTFAGPTDDIPLTIPDYH